MTLASSPGKMDLSALGGLKRRAPLQSVPDAPGEPQDAAPESPQSAVTDGTASAASEAVADAVGGGVVDEVEAPAEVEADTEAADEAHEAAGQQPAPIRIEPAEEEHSGHVTLYLPGDLNKWLAEHHDRTGVSYPGIVLNAISWAAAGGQPHPGRRHLWAGSRDHEACTRLQRP